VPAPPDSRPPLLAALADTTLEAVMFASGSAVRGLVELAGRRADKARRLRAFVIGPKTNAVARELGFTVAGEARTPDAAGLVESLKRHFDEEVTRWVESQLPRSL
jgi:uroporphyrinogen-III synthase